MTASQLAKQVHGVKAGERWMCRCPTSLHRHGDRNRSLSIWESADGWIRVKCFTGCTRDDIVSALGLSIRDLAPNSDWKISPAIRVRMEDKDRLKIMERRHGLFIMLQNVDQEKRNYWSAAERNTYIEIENLSRTISPVDAYFRWRNERAQRIILECGFDKLWERIP